MTSDTCVLSAKQDGGSGDDRDFLLFWASINGIAPTTKNYEATNEEKAYAIQELHLSIGVRKKNWAPLSVL